jgi:intracellular sulfur oxidation DsrE/DsrF family protein
MQKCFLLICCSAFLFVANAQNKVNPVIKGFGTVYEVPFAVENPDPSLNYKVIFDLVTGSEKPEILLENLETVAKFINLQALGGVSSKHLKIITVLHGGAAFIVMNNEAYHKKFGVDNPNLPLITELNKAGVQLFVCGQTLFKRNIDNQSVTPEVKVALSALTTLTTYGLKGYTTLKF